MPRTVDFILVAADGGVRGPAGGAALCAAAALCARRVRVAGTRSSPFPRLPAPRRCRCGRLFRFRGLSAANIVSTQTLKYTRHNYDYHISFFNFPQ
ncbi:hypothetical protein EVAR_34209_1 [Eumeta japonica]|uniref:Uncharacterized protein n=1 Tax=Eumeta variegata TaxID=151549 RepID=A0A4C1WHP8_EUMVA|nr:hypothetical protein EVAR_34209_1 [Eumeta japonica]